MSERSIVLICPKIPPVRDGVGDYTCCLAAELAKRHRVTIITTDGQAPADVGDCRVMTVPGWTSQGMAHLWPILEELKPSLINVQWVPFLWGRWGVNAALPLVALRLRRAGYHVVTTVHEPYVDFHLGRRLPMAVVQRLELWTLMFGSTKVAVSISAWTRMFQTRFFWRHRDIFWLPVGSNIPRLPLEPSEREKVRAALGVSEHDLAVVMFNPLGAGKLLDESYAAWEAIARRQPTAKLLVIGCERHQLGAQLPAADRVICTGYLQPQEVSRALSSGDLCLAAYVDGVSARRGAVMAAMEHGLPTVSTVGPLTDREVFDDSPLVLVPAADRNGFVDAAVRLADDMARRQALQQVTSDFYQRHFSWPLIADRLTGECLTAA